ncbi:YfdX family protein [Thiocapsa bogorovii]|uniref:YfdX family protein n=1 Tax=Thiocapsa bogorovii TaxID=521689 RepID=UPI001E5D5F59|nr:YfdX family protein [Thiocapsa bogorovii]UHD14877.1 YfdX family protein [Thiocapsa bogorovii]
MTKQNLVAAAMASVLSAGMIVSGVTPVFAAEKAPASTPAPAPEQAKDVATEDAVEKDFVKVSEDALLTMRDLHSARLAIFNGLTDQARTYVDASVARVEDAVKDAEKYALATKKPPMDDSYVPFDASLTVMDTLEPSPEKAEHIKKANNHLRRGEKKEALEVLKVGEIDVAVTAGLVPLKFAKEHIDDAAKLIGEGKYYEANLALKAVEDAVVIETFALDAVPEPQGKS